MLTAFGLFLTPPITALWIKRKSRLLALAIMFTWLVSVCPVMITVAITVIQLSNTKPIQTASVSTPGSKPLKVSWYDPDLGGINCMHPCNQMASGTIVTEWRYGKTAACVPEWMYKRVVIDGLGTFDCLDTGGAIKEHPDFIWIDLLLHSPRVPFGTLVYDYAVIGGE